MPPTPTRVETGCCLAIPVSAFLRRPGASKHFTRAAGLWIQTLRDRATRLQTDEVEKYVLSKPRHAQHLCPRDRLLKGLRLALRISILRLGRRIDRHSLARL